MNLNWDKYGIDISKARGGKTICPNCSHTRRHKTDPCLSVDLKTGMFNCHNGCGFKGSAAMFEKPKKEYAKPLQRLEKLSPKLLKWFEERQISNNTLLRFGVTESKEWMPQFEKETPVICFNYMRGEEVVNIKFRGALKSFKMEKGAELIFYNLNALENEKECIICEGEIDCLSFYEAGFYNCVSVPNGANKGSQQLEYLDNCWQYFEKMEKIFVAVDADEAGESLKEELCRRLGKDRCLLVTYPEGCKDANEVLVKYGKDEVSNLISKSYSYPLECESTMDMMAATLMDYYKNGYPKGFKAGINGFDELLSFYPGQLTLVTGVPNSGKDEFINAVVAGLAVNHKQKTAIWGYEEPSTITATKLIEKIYGKAFDFRKDASNRINESQFERGLLFVDEYFKLMDVDQMSADIDSILEAADRMVKRYGINNLVISPWNCIEMQMPNGMSETQYTAIALSKILSFIKLRNVHCFLIAHPTKIQKDKTTKKFEVPSLYSISGSAHFFNKTHNGITVYRDFETNVTDVYVQKCKWSWLGKLGFCSFTYDTLTRQYVSTEQVQKQEKKVNGFNHYAESNSYNTDNPF